MRLDWKLDEDGTRLLMTDKGFPVGCIARPTKRVFEAVLFEPGLPQCDPTGSIGKAAAWLESQIRLGRSGIVPKGQHEFGEDNAYYDLRPNWRG